MLTAMDTRGAMKNFATYSLNVIDIVRPATGFMWVSIQNNSFCQF